MLKISTFFTSTKTSLKATGNSNFLTLEAKLAFFWLKQAFIKTLIFYQFDLKGYISIETDAFGYAMGGVLSQLILKSGQWYLVAFFSKKIIPAKT